MDLDQDLDVDPPLELDGDVEVDPIVDLDLDPRSATSRRGLCVTMTGRSTCKVNEGVDVYVALKVKVSGQRRGQRRRLRRTFPAFALHIFQARIASTGEIRDARIAGNSPPTSPMIPENTIDHTNTLGVARKLITISENV